MPHVGRMWQSERANMAHHPQDIGPEWAPHTQHGDTMPLGDRIKQHRTHLGWSQADLAEAIGTDPRQISRYETGRITPSVDALARIGQALNISLDHLTYDDIPPRPLKAPTTALEPRLNDIAELPQTDQQALLDHLDALLTRTRLHNITKSGGT